MPPLDRSTISREIAKRAQMATLDLDILEELCTTTGPTRNAVVLTADLVARRRMLHFGDPVGLVVESLTNLNLMGWVSYSLGLFEIPVRIRPTKLGFHVAGYPLVYREIGRERWMPSNTEREDDASIRAGDGTDFRNHSFRTTGGPIEVMELWRHLIVYPDHLDMHAAALREIQQERGENMTSVREVIMDGVFDAGHPISTNELFDAIKDKRPMSMMDVVGQIWGLQKTGELTFKERKGQSGKSEHHGGDLVGITLTAFGERNVSRRRGIPVQAAEHDRPFIRVTHEELLEGIGMKPIEPPERPKVEVTDRLTAWERPKPSDEQVVAAGIMAEKIGLKVTEQYDPQTLQRGFSVRRAYSTVTDQGSHPVGRDMTDPKRHGPRAKGGPITRDRVAPQVAAEQPQVPAELPSSPAEDRENRGTSLSLSPMTDLAIKFPLIWRTVNRQEKANAAAKLLEEMGREDLAIQALEVEFSDLEKEVIELVKELG